MVRISIEGQLPDVDGDADDGRFGADPPMVQAMYAGAGLHPDPGLSISTGDVRQYMSSSSQWKHALDSLPEPGEWRARDQNKLDIDIRSNDNFAERMTHPGATAKQRQDILDRTIRSTTEAR